MSVALVGDLRRVHTIVKTRDDVPYQEKPIGNLFFFPKLEASHHVCANHLICSVSLNAGQLLPWRRQGVWGAAIADVRRRQRKNVLQNENQTRQFHASASRATPFNLICVLFVC